MSEPFFWLASYPRSGNTFVRTILFHCFGLRSASLYPNDLGESATREQVGHIEHGPNRSIDFGSQPVMLVKTHHPPVDGRPAIYVVRDGRAATSSLYDFWRGKAALMDIVEGRNRFGTWSQHLERWQPRERPGTLLLRYEDVIADTPSVVEILASHLELGPTRHDLPTRDDMARADGKWIRGATEAKTQLSGAELERFLAINAPAMREYGYL